jgi:hypothetical protein
MLSLLYGDVIDEKWILLSHVNSSEWADGAEPKTGAESSAPILELLRLADLLDVLLAPPIFRSQRKETAGRV